MSERALPAGASAKRQSAEETRQAPAALQTPGAWHSASLAMVGLLAGIYMLRWASPVFIPLMLALLFSYALAPVVDRLVRWHLPRAVAAGLLILVMLGGSGWTIYSLGDDASALVESLPLAAQKLRLAVQQRGTGGPVERVQQAASELESASEATSAPPAPVRRGVVRVQVEKPRLDVKGYLWTGTLGFAALLGQIMLVSFLTYFLLASGDAFRRRLVTVAGPTFARRKITVQALDEITVQIQRFVLVNLFTGLLVAVVTWIAFQWIGLEHAAVWGAAAGIFNLVPYVGAVAVTGGAVLVGYVQFGSMDSPLLIAGASLLINSIEGYLLTPWLTSRASRINPAVVFVGVLFWGWMWGVWGLLLGVPILVALKAVCDRVDDLRPIGELLGDGARSLARAGAGAKTGPRGRNTIGSEIPNSP